MASAATTRDPQGLDTTVRLLTPERISFQYPLAGPFRRALAFLFDLVIWIALLIVALIVSLALALGTSAGVGVYLVAVFVLQWGYGAGFEGLNNGQTPGKWVMGLRVVSDRGTPIVGAQAILRNLTWAFEGLLPFAYLPALAAMVLGSKFQRLGDLAAGTMVVVEARPPRGSVAKVVDKEVDAVLPWLPPRIDAGPELARALADYVKGRSRFSRERREEMAGYLARPARRRYNLPDEARADAVVCALYQRVFHGD